MCIYEQHIRVYIRTHSHVVDVHMCIDIYICVSGARSESTIWDRMCWCPGPVSVYVTYVDQYITIFVTCLNRNISYKQSIRSKLVTLPFIDEKFPIDGNRLDYFCNLVFVKLFALTYYGYILGIYIIFSLVSSTLQSRVMMVVHGG